MRFLSAIALLLQLARPNGPPAESTHSAGPNGLSGWTLRDNFDGDELSTVLLIARQGKVVRRIQGNPIVWRWMFTADGKRVAYESGPLHYGLITCYLTDIQSGKEVANFDCSRNDSGIPNWVVRLESQAQ